MAKQASRMMIGVFVVLAVTIMAASLVVFGSGKFFKKTNKYLLFFDESVKGLSVGAPVLFQGVQIGEVDSIEIVTDFANLHTEIPVIVEVEPEKWHAGAASLKMSEAQRKAVVAKLIEKGLRAVLGMQSFITGQLVIELGFYRDLGVCYPPAKIDKKYKDYILIPTCPSTAERLANALEKLDLQALEKHLESTLAGVDRVANNPDLPVGIRALKDTLQNASKLVTRVDRQVEPLAGGVKKTVNDIGKLARHTDAHVEPVVNGLDKTMTAARGTLSEDSPLMVELQNTLHEMSAMSRSLRQLADYLDQHPEALIRGKAKPGGK